MPRSVESRPSSYLARGNVSMGEPNARIQHSAEFKKRRTLNWLVLGLTYSAMYMGRYNLGFVNLSLSETYGWDKSQIGWIITTALSIYGFSAIFNGPIADRLGGRRAMLIGASGTVVFNFFFGLGAYFGFLGKGPLLLAYFASVWGLSSYFQSFSALALIKVNAGWFHVTERGVFSAIFGAMIQMGRLAIFAIAPVLVFYLPWQWVFFVPAMLVSVMAFLTFKVVHNGPEDVNLPPLDVQDASSGDTEKVSLSYVARKVFTNPVMLMIALAEFCTGVVRHGFEQWFPRYMQEAQGLALNSPIFQKGALAVVAAGVVGAFAAGYLSDWFFKNRRPPVAFLGYAVQVVSLLVIWKSTNLNFIIAAFVMNSFAISIVHSMLSGTASMDFGGKRAAATAAGLFDGMQYVGGSFVGIGMGWLLEQYGWTAWGPSMVGFSAVGGIIMLFLWNARPKTSSSGH
ncbi:MAG: MFS transporter [Proteobacteria bacterium]|nr:MAG: MFS transporter [Pseudomonadota bacterium]